MLFLSLQFTGFGRTPLRKTFRRQVFDSYPDASVACSRIQCTLTFSVLCPHYPAEMHVGSKSETCCTCWPRWLLSSWLVFYNDWCCHEVLGLEWEANLAISRWLKCKGGQNCTAADMRSPWVHGIFDSDFCLATGLTCITYMFVESTVQGWISSSDNKTGQLG